MAETQQEYETRLASYVAGRDWMQMQREAPGRLARLTDGVAEERLRRRPAAAGAGPGRWSVGEILAHLAEDELSSSWRYRQMIEHDGSRLEAFDQDMWARLADYAAWDPREALTMFRLVREANVRLLDGLTEEQWGCSGVHVQRGRITVRELARHMAAHDVNHMEQIERLLGG
jgi:uncharacterized damage-inducible protein DinB